MFTWFEKRVDPYPDVSPEAPPKGFFSFLWASTQGLRPFINS